jgi:hypothetical protein
MTMDFDEKKWDVLDKIAILIADLFFFVSGFWMASVGYTVMDLDAVLISMLLTGLVIIVLKKRYGKD